MSGRDITFDIDLNHFHVVELCILFSDKYHEGRVCVTPIGQTITDLMLSGV